ncbi:uncharacterized protein [Diadema antillarum]|uniref:uncharacterized protein n=1 Tax=Diadema antillarum TaxID=105358 RepID=UPI003A8746EF
MSGYSYGHRSGFATQYGGGGGGGNESSYHTNANSSARPSNGQNSYGAMAYPHIPSINESAEFSGSCGAEQLNFYHRQNQSHNHRMNSGDHVENRMISSTNMDATAYHRQSIAGMQSGYPGMAGRRASVPPNAATNSYPSSIQRSQSFPPPADGCNNRGIHGQSSYQTNLSNQMQNFGDGYPGYSSQNQSQSSMTMSYQRPAAMMKSNEMWDRTNASQMGPNSYSSSHAVTPHYSNRTANQHHLQSGVPYASQSQTTSRMYPAAGHHIAGGMQSAATDMSMTIGGESTSSEFGMRSNQCVNSTTMMGQSYGSNQAIYGSTPGMAHAGPRMRMPHQRHYPSPSFNSTMCGNQTLGSVQKLRHFGPMPNSSPSFSRTNPVRQPVVPTHGSNTRNMGAVSTGMNTQHSGWQTSSASHGGYNNPNSQTSQMNNVPYSGLPPPSNMPPQQMNYSGTIGGMSMQQQPQQQQQQQQQPRNYSGTMHSNAMMENVATPAGMYPQNAQCSGAANPGHFLSTGSHSQEKFDSLSSTQFPNSVLNSDTDTVIQQLNQDRIFSAELEKLARLSRNPMSDDFVPTGSSDTAPATVRDDVNTACAGSSTFQPQTTVDELLDGPGCIPSVNSDSSSNPVKLSDPSTLSTSSQKSPNVSVSGSYQTNCSGSQQEQASSSSAPQTPNSTVGASVSLVSKAPANTMPSTSKNETSAECTQRQDKSGDGGENQNSVQQLQKMTQSIKDTSKQEDLMKVASSQHAEYLSHSSSDGYGSQNCIAALSAACRNIIADMDSSMPKQNGPQKVHSPLSAKKHSFENASSYGVKSDALTGFGGGMPAVTTMADQFVVPSSCSMTSVPNCNVPMDSYNTFSTTYNNGVTPMPMTDFQGKYHDFLEQNVPMQMGGRRMDEKPRKGRRRRKSEEFSTDHLISGSIPQTKPKRKYRKRSAQNPPSVESMEGPLSVDNVAFTPLSESSSHQADDMGYRSATQTPNSVHNSWGMDAKMSCSDSISIAMSIADGNQMEHVSQDLLDSVFSPDTTMSSTTNPDLPESGSCVMQGSPPVIHNRSPLRPPNLNNNHPISTSHKRNMFLPQSNNTVSSTGEAASTYISTSTHSGNGCGKPKDTEEAHPLEILQEQIKIQRKQFNLGETNPSKKDSTTTNNMRVENHESKSEPPLPSDLDMDLLTSEETWYLPEDQPKDVGEGGGLWDDLCQKGQTNTSSKPLLLAMQS